MLRFILKRILILIPVLIGVTFVVYTILSLTPGDPALTILGENATPEAVAELREKLGLNEPFLMRYINYIVNLVQGDMGHSWRLGTEVSAELARAIPKTVVLAGFSTILAFLVGVPVGTISAVKQYSFVDNASLALALFLSSFPGFWLALMLLLVFGVTLDWVPVMGVDELRGWILPIVTVMLTSLGSVIRMSRSSMLEVIRQDYIRTARAKGASERRIVMRHSLKNALLPVITVLGVSFANGMGGTIVLESVFTINGIGTLLITSVRAKDIPAALGCVLFVAAGIGIINLLVDILYTWVDPRLKTEFFRMRRKKGGAQQ